ncbi:response regulator transcription factor [Tritonibacter mobilis]|uniref:response regulator transcription factor n=1 Tax=Tritonibacter mobilis TaxID=379347 RepID=UPI000806AF68|nr:response regulator transcription factor [Tritonibacter mobilis]
MLIKFSVLWVEDDDRWFTASRRILKKYLDDLGFFLDVTRISDPENTSWDQHFEATSQYDLMLVDWRIEQTNKVDKPVGGDVIKRIREEVPYSDILFYSGSDGLEEEVYEKNLQGVYTTKRNQTIDEAKELINHLLHKSLHPKIMRGMIVSSLSQIDDMCFKIIEHKYNDAKCNRKAFAEGFRSSISSQAASQFKAKTKAIKKGDDDFIASLHNTMILDSHKRAIKLIELLEGDLETAKHEKLKSLPDTIIKRNWLAHWKRSEETDTKITLIHSGKSDYIFDQNEATRMRKKINEAGEILNQYLLEVS